MIYNLVLLLLGVPWLLYQRVVQKKYRGSLKSRLGLTLPKEQEGFVIWIHAISMGETRAAIPLYQQLRKTYPDAKIVISTTTETGQKEAQRSLPGADDYFYLPLDLSWNIKRYLKRLKPQLLILVEGEIWYNLLTLTKKAGTKITLVNGKISERSSRRFSLFQRFTKPLINHIDQFCVQSQEHAERFEKMGIPPNKMAITGNLKYDIPLHTLTLEEKQQWQTRLKILPADHILVIASTHESEEEQLLMACQNIPNLKILLAPRHPERFEKVASDLERAGRSWIRYSDIKDCHPIILINTMGIMPILFQLADIAIIGGSYVPGYGGHNVFEATAYGVPTFFGPFMGPQRDLGGQEVTLDNLASEISLLLSHEEERKKRIAHCLHITQKLQGAAVATLEEIKKL